MRRIQKLRQGVAWLEILLALAVLSLVIQLFPGAPLTAARMLDVRNWSSWIWFAVNAILFAIFCGIKYAPYVIAQVREDRHRRAAAVVERSKVKGIEDRKREAAEKRTFYQRVRESRRRRMW
jgi:hypothetical protein